MEWKEWKEEEVYVVFVHVADWIGLNLLVSMLFDSGFEADLESSLRMWLPNWLRWALARTRSLAVLDSGLDLNLSKTACPTLARARGWFVTC